MVCGLLYDMCVLVLCVSCFKLCGSCMVSGLLHGNRAVVLYVR